MRPFGRQDGQVRQRRDPAEGLATRRASRRPGRRRSISSTGSAGGEPAAGRAADRARGASVRRGVGSGGGWDGRGRHRLRGHAGSHRQLAWMPRAGGSTTRASGSTAGRPISYFVRVFVLGLDPGLSRCGYARARAAAPARRPGPWPSACSPPRPPIRCPSGWPSCQRDLRALFDEHQPEAVAVERVLFQVNVRTAMSVGQASGLAMAEAAGRGCEVVQYSPNEVKQAVTGYGAATKEQVQHDGADPARPGRAARRRPTRPTPPRWRCATWPSRRWPQAAAGPTAVGRSAPMIGSLRGTLLDRWGDGEVLIEVGRRRLPGHGHARPPSSSWASPAPRCSCTSTTTSARTPRCSTASAPATERDVLRGLLAAHGVGPALALAILSVHGPDALARCVADDDIDALCLVPGVGKKTAARLLIELKSSLERARARRRRRGPARRRDVGRASARVRRARGAGQPRLRARRGGVGGPRAARRRRRVRCC